MGSEDLLKDLHTRSLRNGKPRFVHNENLPEFASRATWDQLEKIGVKPNRINLGTIRKKVYDEWFNGALHREIISAEKFTKAKKTHVVINFCLR